MIEQYLTHKDPRIKKIAGKLLTFYKKKKYYKAHDYIKSEQKAGSEDYTRTLEEIEKKVWKKTEKDYDTSMATCIKIQIILIGIMIICLIIRVFIDLF